MSKQNVAVGKVALTLAFLMISYTAFGADNTVKDHQPTEAAPPTPSAAPGSAVGSIPAPVQTGTPEDRAKLRNFQVKSFIASTAQNLPVEQKQKLLTALAAKPKDAAQAAAQKKLAKDIIDSVPKDLLPDQDKQQLNASFAKLAGDTPATAEELQKAAEELLKPADPAAAGASAQAAAGAAQNPGGATSDPTKVAKGDGKGVGKGDPKADAESAFKTQIGDLNKKVADLTAQLAKGGDPAQNAGLNKALGDLAKGDQGNEKGQGTGSGSGSPSGSESGGQPTPSKASDSSESKQPDHNSAKNDSKNDKKDLPPLFADSKGGKDGKDAKENENKGNQEATDDKPLIDTSKLKAEAEKQAELAKAAEAEKNSKKALEQPTTDGLGDGGVADVGAPPSQSDLPPGNSQVGQSIAGGGGGGAGNFDFGAGGGDSGGGGGLGSSPVAGGGGGGGGASGSGFGEFPNGVGMEGGGYPGPIKYAYDKGNGIYKGGGGGDTGGGDGDDGVDGGSDYSSPQIAANALSKKQFASIDSQILIAPNRNGTSAKRPGPFALTEIARAFVDPRSKKNSAGKAKQPSEDSLAFGGNSNLTTPAGL